MHPLAMIGIALTGLLTLAMVAVLVSQKSQTGTVIASAGTALSGLIQAAVSPVTGAASGGVGNLLGGSTGNSLSGLQVPNFTQQFLS